MTRRSLLAVLGVAALAVTLLAASLLFRPDAARSALAIGGPFHLASARGGAVDSKELAGKPYAVFFGYTHCPEVCPTTLYEMSQLLVKLGDAGKDFRVFFITVDPERDTASGMADYISNFDPRIEALVPTLEQLPQLASDFRVYYAKQPTSDGGYSMDHTATTFLFDRKGAFAGTMAFGEATEMREAKVRKLVAGR